MFPRMEMPLRVERIDQAQHATDDDVHLAILPVDEEAVEHAALA